MRRPSPHAVAVGYDSENDQAPRVLAKGSGLIAENIIQAARHHGVPLVADPIAGELLAQVELGAEIPPDFYQAVAEIMAFIYRLNDQLNRS